MSIVNPYTGQPVAKPGEISQQQLLELIQITNRKVDQMNMQIIQVGIFVDYIAEALQQVPKSGEPILEEGEEKFTEFAQKRFAEIKEEAAAYMEQQKREALANLTKGANTNELSLDEV